MATLYFFVAHALVMVLAYFVGRNIEKGEWRWVVIDGVWLFLAMVRLVSAYYLPSSLIRQTVESSLFV